MSGTEKIAFWNGTFCPSCGMKVYVTDLTDDAVCGCRKPASPVPAPADPARILHVGTSEELSAACQMAKAGDAIAPMAGVYRAAPAEPAETPEASRPFEMVAEDLRTLVKSEAGHIAYVDDEINLLKSHFSRLRAEVERLTAEREELAAAILPDAEKRKAWTVQNIAALASAHRDDSLEVDATEMADKSGNSYDYSEVGGELRRRAEAAESSRRQDRDALIAQVEKLIDEWRTRGRSECRDVFQVVAKGGLLNCANELEQRLLSLLREEPKS